MNQGESKRGRLLIFIKGTVHLKMKKMAHKLNQITLMRIQKSPYSLLGKARKKGPKLSLEPKERIPEKD